MTKYANSLHRHYHVIGNVKKITDVNVVFQQYATEIGEKSKVDERKRITREIHDAIGYSFTNIVRMMEAAGLLLNNDSDKTREMLREAQRQAQYGLNETRRALHIIRSVEEEQVYGLRLIYRLVMNFEKATKIKVFANYLYAGQ